jgi:predicted MFS family arabinose efflux permease
VLVRPGVLAGLLATMLHVGSFFVTVQLAATWLDARGYVGKTDQIWLWIGLGLASVAGSLWCGRIGDWLGKRNFVLLTSVLLVAGFLVLAREPGPVTLAAVGTAIAVVAAARTGPLQALLSGLVPPEQMAALMAWRGFAMQLGVGLFALGAGTAAERLQFPGVLMLAALCQGGSYLAIRFGVRERAAVLSGP